MFGALYGSKRLPRSSAGTVEKRPPEGAVGRCPAGFALDSGQDCAACATDCTFASVLRSGNALHAMPQA